MGAGKGRGAEREWGRERESACKVFDLVVEAAPAWESGDLGSSSDFPAESLFFCQLLAHLKPWSNKGFSKTCFRSETFIKSRREIQIKYPRSSEAEENDGSV